MRNPRAAGRPVALALSVLLGIAVAAPGTRASGNISSITAPDLKEWLTYIASDELEGRATFSAGIGLAAAYIEDHLRAWGVKPAGDRGGYLQSVRVLGVKVSNHSSVTVDVGGQSRTFSDGQGVTFARNVGAKRRLTVSRVEFSGYGLDAPRANHVDYAGKDVAGAAVVWLGTGGPGDVDASTYQRLLNGRNQYAVAQLHAAAAIGAPNENGAARGAAGAGAAAAPNAGGRGGPPQPVPDFLTTQRLDSLVPPAITGSDGFFEFLFSQAPAKYDELKRKAANREALPSFPLKGVTLTFDIDADYQIVRTQLAQNVVGAVDGGDAQLRTTYVAFGAHYDHLGYAEGEIVDGRRAGAPGRVTDGALDDRVWNGADDDGSGTVAVMAIARAFAQGPRPRRSLLFVWHAGEERGLWGSRYFADYPTVALDRIVTQLNIDMIGRNRDNKSTESNTVYLVGSDRISSELHEISQAANAQSPRPLAFNYEFNDPSDLEQLYFRSDHYSYAAKGIPIIFFTTGLHPDYHTNTDEVSKIEFEKLTRITQMIYETGWRVANLDHAPVRDNKGPRAGKAVATK
jgi:hypothetical protein